MENTITSTCGQYFNAFTEGLWRCLSVVSADSSRSRVSGVVQHEASTLIIDREGVHHESSCCNGCLTYDWAKFLKSLYTVVFLCVCECSENRVRQKDIISI